MKNFKEYSGLNLSEVNKKILEYWNEHDMLRKSVEIREGHPSFVFYEGPTDFRWNWAWRKPWE